MLRIGVLGAGHLGKIHIKLIKELKDYHLVGFYDNDEDIALSAAAELKVPRYESYEDLLENVDAIDIVTPTLSHYDCAVKALKSSKHIFIEKPITHTVEEARHLIELAEEADVKAQVGHVERFNPAFLAIKEMELNPMFIETHRLAQFNPRGTDVSVILDLMIHDIDIILSVVKSNVKKISANGVAVISNTPDIANARIEFDNGCVANITCSRISMKQMRKIRMFQKNAYISMDLLDKSTDIIQLSDVQHDPESFEIGLDNNGIKKYVSYEKVKTPDVNSIKMELELFAKCIKEGGEPSVSLTDGYNALHIAYQILNKVEKNKMA